MTIFESPVLWADSGRVPRGDLAAGVERAAAVTAVRAGDADKDRLLHPQVVQAATEAGFPRYFVPSRWRGTQGTFAELLCGVAALGEKCASAAWCAGLWAAHGRFAAYLPTEGQRDLWRTGPDVRIAAGVMPPSGAAVRVAGNWQLQGEWECVSAAEAAEWLLLAARDTSGGDRPVRVFLVPQRQVVVRDVWHSTGLRGTAGNSVVVAAPVNVPDHRTFLLQDLLRGTPGPGRARCHAVPAPLGGGLLFAAPALGAARHALRAWGAWATSGSDAEAPVHTQASVRETLARSSAEIDAAGLLLEEAARRADTAAVTASAVARGQRDAAYAVELLVTAVERLFRTGGRHARTDSGALQRCWRDVHTVAAHGALRMETVAGAYSSAACAS